MKELWQYPENWIGVAYMWEFIVVVPQLLFHLKLFIMKYEKNNLPFLGLGQNI